GQRGQEHWIIINELKRDFTVKEVSLGVDKIDDDVKVLVVIYPREISDGAQYAIDQFVLRGGKVVAFLDPLSIADNRSSNPSNPLQGAMSSGATMDKLLKAWGIEFDVSKAVADMTFKTNIRGQDGRPKRTGWPFGWLENSKPRSPTESQERNPLRRKTKEKRRKTRSLRPSRTILSRNRPRIRS